MSLDQSTTTQQKIRPNMMYVLYSDIQLIKMYVWTTILCFSVLCLVNNFKDGFGS